MALASASARAGELIVTRRRMRPGLLDWYMGFVTGFVAGVGFFSAGLVVAGLFKLIAGGVP